MHQLASLEWSDGFDTLMKQRSNEIVKKLTCHCGGVEIEVLLPKGLINLGKCNCSICKRRSAIMAKVNLEDLEVVKGKEKLKKDEEKERNKQKEIRTERYNLTDTNNYNYYWSLPNINSSISII